MLFNYPSIANSSDLDDKILITKKEVLPNPRSFTVIKNVSRHIYEKKSIKNETLQPRNDEYDDYTNVDFTDLGAESSENVEESTKNENYDELSPSPFQKFDYNKNYPQLSNYRNAFRLKNIDELIRYMNNQFDKERNSRKTIKFSGIYINPKNDVNEDSTNDSDKKLTKKSNVTPEPMEFSKVEKSDPFVRFKPRNVGEINLLAENQFRFAPRTNQNRLNHHRIYRSKKNCEDNNKFVNRLHPMDLENFEEPQIPNTAIDSNVKKRPLSVMLDIYPMEDEDEKTMAFPEHLKEPSTPTSQYQRPYFKPMPNTYPIYTNPYPYYHYPNNNNYYNRRKPYFTPKNNQDPNKPTQMLVHLNLFPRKKILKNVNIDRKIRDHFQLHNATFNRNPKFDFLNVGEVFTDVPVMERRSSGKIIETTTIPSSETTQIFEDDNNSTLVFDDDFDEMANSTETTTIAMETEEKEETVLDNFLAVPLID